MPIALGSVVRERILLVSPFAGKLGGRPDFWQVESILIGVLFS